MQDVGVGGQGNQTFNYWHDGLASHNCSLTQFQRVGIGGINTGGGKGRLIDTGTGIAFTGSEAVQFTLRDVTTNGWNTAISTFSGGHNLSDLEGFVFDNWQANQVMDALVNLNQVGDGYRSPQYVITNSQFNVCRRLLYLAQVEEVLISNNLVYTCGAGAQTGGTANYDQYVGTVRGSAASGSKTLTLTATAPGSLTAGVPIFGPGIGANNKVASVSGVTVTLLNATTAAISSQDLNYGAGSPGFDATGFININAVSNFTLRDNVVRVGRTGNIATFGRFLNSYNGTIENSVVGTVFNQSLQSGWWNNTGNNNIVEKRSTFEGTVGWFEFVSNPLDGADRGNRFELHYAKQGAALRSDKSIQIDGSAAFALDSGKLGVITLPAIFTQLPASIQISNGDVGANAVWCGVNSATTTANQIGVSCPQSVGGAPIRVDYSVISKQ
ncbi:hypothetical protein [Methylorubrum extorquens]|uniref:hypothetical protein n=1 Tax=Methylorubrum extorquens TaxID=408 RepID=UPI00209F2D3C|nr:hypothetical protein [Methylorubrum extorquens]MCP1539009.1 hypothetical protein [Methylorubrum extorquens]